MSTPAFRESEPVAWSFHRNTSVGMLQSSPEPLSESPQAPKEHPHAPLLRLPEPALPDVSLGSVLAGRASCRRFASDPLDLGRLATVLAAAYGVSGRFLVGRTELMERPVPSGGGLYPLELYVLASRVEGVTPGVHHYAPLLHGLEHIVDEAVPQQSIARLFLGQPYVGEAAAVVVLTAVLRRSLVKYRDRGYRYVLFEAGHVAQNLNLAATACDLGSCNLGGFFDDHVADLLDVDPDEEVPLYAVAVGVPAVADRIEMRSVAE